MQSLESVGEHEFFIRQRLHYRSVRTDRSQFGFKNPELPRKEILERCKKLGSTDRTFDRGLKVASGEEGTLKRPMFGWYLIRPSNDEDASAVSFIDDESPLVKAADHPSVELTHATANLSLLRN